MSAVTEEETGAMIRAAVAREHARFAECDRKRAEARARQDALNAESDRRWENVALVIWEHCNGRWTLDEIRKDLGIIR